ncbi:hypothetical protein bIBBF13_gp31 [Lactococcus phage vB_Llc_bIBBF13]|uniref:Uncharacterized protein n=8 Tax=Skunavirus TaxID=1623305 RepID=A0A2Z2XW50_9CAUD|nr:hypothetical protein bIBB29_gp32 [Lactococcus phage bIBB29]YP_009879336.1 hypothetical protein HYP52_gp33 [Lactococcus phage vB_Llc_bIBB5g1]YP_009879389.1 hypothetical protein HYP53_gp31 [Lactococcus phage vB_Llc_bIBBF12]ASR76023.1 hypothetical protein bIBBF14_gp32 [Lactococcus phage vB_Llc_bIBBF14]ATW69530.1 hypothetical protein bIBB14s_gp32 [Lactococcus phage vB_Llc_bIBB14s]ATW69587.1 hypothetical protein bIBB24tp1_gp32 [Lactococcus phage vB_Llc_bIBB24tp1]ATW69641.1 hypothetical protein 
MTEKIIISKELNEWLEEHQTLDTDNTLYDIRFSKEIFDELFEEVWLEIDNTESYKNTLAAFGLSGNTKQAHLWLLLNRDKWEVEEDELFYICIPEPHDRNGYLAKDIGLEFFLKAPNQKRYFWTQEEIDKHEVAKHLQHFKRKVE